MLEEPAKAGARRALASLKMRDWRGLRLALAKDRSKLLQFFCAATSYRPMRHMVSAHIGGLTEPEWDPIKKIWASAKTNKLELGGIGAGKTAVGGAEITMAAIANPGGWHLMAGPTHDQVANVNLPHWERYVEELEQSGYPLAQGQWHKTAKQQRLVCGGKMFARTYGKVGGLLGFEFTTAWLDEIDTIPRSALVWDTIDGRIRRPGAQWRQILGTTTPNGLQGVVAKFHAAREIAKAIDDPVLRHKALSRWIWHRNTALDNPYLPANYLDGLRAHYSSRRWKQEVLAEILRPAAVVWEEFDEDRHCIEFKSFAYQTMEYDLAYDAGDQYPHVLWIARDAQGRAIVFDELCIDNIPAGKLHEEIVKRCKALRREPTYIVCDRAVKREIGWAREQFPMSTVAKMDSRLEQSVSEGIEVVRDLLDPYERAPQLLFAKHLAESEERRGIVKCLQNYSYKTDMHGVITSIPHKDNVHDHGADALRMLCVKRYAGHSSAYTLTRRHI